MDQVTEKDPENTEETKPDELTMLKQRADQMGISYHPKIGLDTLKAKVNDALTGAPKDKDNEEGEPVEKTAAQKRRDLRSAVRQEALKLVRVRISNLNPGKNDLNGEIFTVANKYIGEVKKYIPYGEATDVGYHIPMCIYNLLKGKKFLQLRTVKSQKLGQPDQVKQRWLPEFALEVLDPLTPDELAQLAKTQAAKEGVSED